MRILSKEEVDFLPSQITFADRTRDVAIHDALEIPENTTLDEYLQNHIHFSLSKTDYPIFFRNDISLMKKLESDGFCKVDEKNGIIYDNWGMGIKVGEEGFYVSFHPLEKKQEIQFAEQWLPLRIHNAVTADTLEERISLYTPPDPEQEGNYDWMMRDIELNDEDYYIVPSGYVGCFERSYGLIGLNEAFINMAGNPMLLEELVSKIADYKIAVARKIISLGFKSGHISDDLATQTGPFFSIETFRKIFRPHYKRIFEVFKNAGSFMWMHSCGDITEFLPDLIDVGLDVLEPVQPCMNLDLLKKEYGKDLVFFGGIDTQELLPYGSPEDVKEMAVETIRTLGKGGGYIIAPSQEIMNDVPLENIVALVETILDEREKAIRE